MNPTTPFDQPLPSLKQQFLTQHFEPVRRSLPMTMPEQFEVAKDDYERAHGHQFPYSYTTFCRAYYER